MIAQLLRRNGQRLARRLGIKQGANPNPGAERTAQWYDQMYGTSESYQQPYYRSVYYFLWCMIADRIRRAGLRRVLEVGCGPGQFAAFLYDQGLVDQFVGLDFSATAIEFARRNAPRGQFQVGDARTTRVHSEIDHDIVICTEVLEHVEDDTEILSLFTPGRRCILTVPSFSHPSHVRVFRDAAEVNKRYGAFFQALDVQTFVSPNSGPGYMDLFFLGEGIRNEYRPDPPSPSP